MAYEYESIESAQRLLLAKQMNAVKLTKSQKTVLRYYLGLGRPRFRCSIPTISAATGVPKRTIGRANARFLELGILSWVRGHGSLIPGAPCRPNEYLINPAAIAAHKRNQRLRGLLQPASVSVSVSGSGPVSGSGSESDTGTGSDTDTVN